jgi:hypothetical protein
MNTVLTVSIDTETQNLLIKRAAAQGISVEQYAIESLRKMARKQTFEEMFADVHAEFEASGMTDEELGELIKQARAEI